MIPGQSGLPVLHAADSLQAAPAGGFRTATTRWSGRESARRCRARTGRTPAEVTSTGASPSRAASSKALADQRDELRKARGLHGGAALLALAGGQGEERSLAMQPSRLSEFITLVRERFEEAAREGEAPVLVTSPAIRPFVRGIVERFRAQTSVLSQSEIHPRVRLKTVGSI